jgi:uncharacterized protein (TIGR03435 family)
MIQRISGCGLAVLACCATALAQGVEGPAFEVASVKPSAPPTPGRMGMHGGPGSAGDPGQITANNMSLMDLMANAYGVQLYQISGPDWMDSQHFDIVAKVPAGATREQANGMWQNLLKERFGLKLHHETKEMPMYALVVARNGLKLKESVAAPAQEPPAGSPDGAPPGPSKTGKDGKDGMPELPASVRRPGTLMWMMMNGRMRVMGTEVTMASLAEHLGRQYDRLVTDQTGLTKTYDVTLDFAPESGGMMGRVRAALHPGDGVVGHRRERAAPSARRKAAKCLRWR